MAADKILGAINLGLGISMITTGSLFFGIALTFIGVFLLAKE